MHVNDFSLYCHHSGNHRTLSLCCRLKIIIFMSRGENVLGPGWIPTWVGKCRMQNAGRFSFTEFYFIRWIYRCVGIEVAACLSLLSIIQTTWAEGSWGRKDLMAATSLIPFHHQCKSGQEFKQEPGGRNWRRCPEGAPLTILVIRILSVWFLMQPRTTCPGMSLPTAAGLTHSSRDCSKECQQVNLMEAYSQVKFPPLRWS